MVTPENVETFVERGRALWKSIYAPHDEKLYNKLGALHPDFISTSRHSFLSPLRFRYLVPTPNPD